MKKRSIIIYLLICSFGAKAQGLHSHNDYEQRLPFYTAFRLGFHSIEADIYFVDGKLLVAHDRKDVDGSRTLEALYLTPLDAALKENKERAIQLLIDIKSEAYTTLDALVQLLQRYPSIIEHKKVKISISGNRPLVKDYQNYPAFIYFDGRPGVHYSKKALKKISLISDSYGNYLHAGVLDEYKLRKVIDAVHQLGKPFRLWAHPDKVNGWEKMISLGVDFINTDNIEELARFMKSDRVLANKKNIDGTLPE